MDENDDLGVADELLSSRSLPAHRDLGRAHLRAKTLTMIGHQRRLRFARWAAVVVIAYVAGWSTPTIIVSPHQTQLPTTLQSIEENSGVSDEELKHVTDVSELVSRKLTREADASSYESLRKAGNIQLVERNDLTAALRLYRRALKAATSAELQNIDKNSTWLWNELKHDRNRRTQEENSNAERTL